MSATGMTTKPKDALFLFYSCDVDYFVQVKICSLQGKPKSKSFKEIIDNPLKYYSGPSDDGLPSYFITAQVYADGRALALPTRTAHKTFTTHFEWNEWLTLPVKYSHLPPTAVLAITIWDVSGEPREVPIGSTTIPLFGKYKNLRQGTFDLRVWADVAATAQNIPELRGQMKYNNTKIAELQKKMKQHRKGLMPHYDWLDRLSFQGMHQTIEEEKQNSDFMFLQVDFPEFGSDDPKLRNMNFDVVYYEKGGDEVERTRVKADLVRIFDPDLDGDNLVESKHHKLTHSLRHGAVVRDLKPDPATRDMLNEIINRPSSMALAAEDQANIWKFRFYLSKEKKALPKFLRYIDWSNSKEADQALELMEEWTPIDVEASLELLSRRYKHKRVRQYAVSRLRHASDEDLKLYMLQLVQALRYEDISDKEYVTSTALTSHFGHPSEQSGEDVGDGHQSTTSQGILDPLGGIPISTEPNGLLGNGIGDVGDPLGVSVAPGTETSDNGCVTSGSNSAVTKFTGNGSASAPPPSSDKDKNMSLAQFLMERAYQNFELASPFHWYLFVETEDVRQQLRTRARNPFGLVLNKFLLGLSQNNLSFGRSIRLQQFIISKLHSILVQVASGKESRPKKIEKLRNLLNTSQFISFEPFPLPLDPTVMVKGIIPSQAHLFKSALMPAKITFVTTNDEEYVTIYKTGDDLRQDQLVLQMVTLMDRLLRQEKIDLKLSPYLCLATSPTTGFVQYLESLAVAQVLSTDGSIQAFFKRVAPCPVTPSNPSGIQPEVMDTYVRSCAGYCVITYLLGIGDRHLDNLLLTTSGHLFHIDFGFMLGRDPKPFPPPMKLSKEMVEGMGGQISGDYQKFRSHCYLAFLILRRSANLILNLWELMVDANIGDIALEPDKAAQKIQDKFCLDMSEEEAVKYFQELIDESVSALFAVMVERIHKWAQYWRR